ncbi:hypothetical protein V8J88_06410 [Massilia sp. W12]|uniref:hypothetical protein n=1 Tax=Massilia sp. W12 TaxID=3126507 RepID=UPI0030CEE6A0
MIELPKELAEWQVMRVRSIGLCCSVGYQAASAVCALRAGIDHFQEGAFLDNQGEALALAALPAENHAGLPRLTWLAQHALQDCARQEMIDSANTCLLLLAAERSRPHTDVERYQASFDAIGQLFSSPFHSSSLILPLGRAGIGHAIWQAQALLRSKQVQKVLILGLDSYLNAATINHYLRQDRLLCSYQSNGFIPGEAAAAIMLELPEQIIPGLYVRGLGLGMEEAQPGNGVPNRAQGMSIAMRQACASAHLTPSELDFRLSDQNGEVFFSREAATASMRLMAHPDNPESIDLPVLTTADCLGEIGAATGCAMLAWMQAVMPRNDGPGLQGLMHLANEDGRRSALALTYWKG